MAKKDCSAGQKWDHLVNTCVPSQTETRTEPVPTEPTMAVVDRVKDMISTTQADPPVMLSQALWIFVVLATVGSIVALALWFIICRRQTRLNSTAEDAEPGHELLQKTETPAKKLHSERNGQADMFQRAAEAPSLCPHLHLGAPNGSKWEEGLITCRGLAKHVETDGGRGLPECSTVIEHRIPLPATELGGTALVTTKTV